MSKKNSGAKTVNGTRHFNCKRCGKPVAMSLWHWRKLKPEHKRICKDCIRLATTDHSPGYEPGRYLSSIGRGHHMFGGF